MTVQRWYGPSKEEQSRGGFPGPHTGMLELLFCAANLGTRSFPFRTSLT